MTDTPKNLTISCHICWHIFFFFLKKLYLYKHHHIYCRKTTFVVRATTEEEKGLFRDQVIIYLQLQKYNTNVYFWAWLDWMSMWLIFIIFCSLSAPLAYHISILFSQTTEATQKKHKWQKCDIGGPQNFVWFLFYSEIKNMADRPIMLSDWLKTHL